MNKALIFFAGLLVGGAAGASATYLILHDRLVADAQDEIDRYAEHCEERIASIRAKYAGEQPDTAPVEDEDEEDPDDRDEALIRRNKGVKLYHHTSEYMGSNDTVNSIFEKDKVEEKKEVNEELKKEIDAGVEKLLAETPHISEITQEEYDNDGEYEKESIEYFFDGDSDRAYWGYGTDNQTTVEARFGNPLSALIGASSRWLNDYADKESGYGEAYFRNEEMKTDFEIVIHDNTV